MRKTDELLQPRVGALEISKCFISFHFCFMLYHSAYWEIR